MADEGTLLPSAEPPEPVRKVRGDALSRADEAWRLRVVGATWAQAASAVGFANAENAMRCVREAYGSLPEVDKAEMRTLWRERLEALWTKAYRDALEGRSGAITAAVRVAQAAARLDGLDAPTEITVHDPTQQEIEAWVAEVLRTRTPTLEEADIFAGGEDIVEGEWK